MRHRVTLLVGVWIETINVRVPLIISYVTPLVGVWIETLCALPCLIGRCVTPLVGVWIETTRNLQIESVIKSQPSEAQVLKYRNKTFTHVSEVKHHFFIVALN